MFTLIVLAFFVIPAMVGAMKLALRLLGWTLRMTLSIFLLPVWIVILLVGGLASAAAALAPLAIVAFLIMLLVPQD